MKHRISEEEIGTKVHYVKFVYDGDAYMAFGESEIGMRVYKEFKPRLYVRHGGVTWPGWTKYHVRGRGLRSDGGRPPQTYGSSRTKSASSCLGNSSNTR